MQENRRREDWRFTEDLIRDLWDEIPDGMRLTDREGRVLAVNKNYCHLAGLRREQLLGRSFAQIHPEQERAHVLEHYREFIEGQMKRSVVRRRWKTAQGRDIWVEGVLKRLEIGGEVAVLAIFRKINKAKGLEQQLRRQTRLAEQAQRRFQAIITSSSVGIGILNARWRVEEASDSLCRLLCRPREQVIGRAWRDLVDGCSELSDESGVDARPWTTFNRLCRPTAGPLPKCLWVEIKPVPVGAYRRHPASVVVATDLSRLEDMAVESTVASAAISGLLEQIARLAGREPEETEFDAHVFLRALGLAYGADRATWYQYDRDRQICTRHAEWAREGCESGPDTAIQFPLDQFERWVASCSCGDYVEIEDVSQLGEPQLKAALERRGIQSIFGVPIVDEGRCEGWIALHAVKQPRRFGRNIAWMVKAMAQTVVGIERLHRLRREKEVSRERLEEALRESERMREAAEQASRAKSQFLAMMSHEIRTPLNGVLGVLSLLESSPLPVAMREYVAMARETGHALLTLMNDLLEIARIDANKIEICETDVDLLQQMEQAVASVAESAAAKGLTLMTLVDPQLPERIRMDSARLRQVLLNLLGNAVKFTSRGSVVLKAEIEQIQGKPTIRFTVRDTGPGIAPTDIDRIFDPFYRALGHSADASRGAGLGLALSRRLVDKMGGQLGVRSELGCGSEFYVTLPLQCAAEAGSLRMQPLSGLRVAVLDNNSEKRNAVCTQLVGWGATVEDTLEIDGCDAALVSVSTAEEAAYLLQDWRRSNPDSRLRVALVAPLGKAAGLEEFAGNIGAQVFVEPLRWSKFLRWLRSGNSCSGGLRPSAGSQPQYHQSGNPVARVLVADDNAVNRHIVKALLEKLGCQVETAGSGEEAVQRMADSQPDLAFIDLEMPGMDGFEVARRVRHGAIDGVSTSLPLLALTAHVLPQEREKAMKAGCDEFLCKPVSFEDLRDALQKWLPQTRGDGNEGRQGPTTRLEKV